MANNLDHEPNLLITRHKSPGGHTQILPILGADRSQTEKIHVNGQFNPDMSTQEVISYLLDPRVYGSNHRRIQGNSRNFRR